MRMIGVISAAALFTSACTSTLRPVQVNLPSAAGRSNPCGSPNAAALGGGDVGGSGRNTADTPDTNAAVQSDNNDVDAQGRLRWYVCALEVRAHRNLAQSLEWQNQTEWRDIPLLGAAATVAGLVLFGRRDGQNNLVPGEQEAIQITGFAAAGLGALTNYLSPATARRLLRQGARGHYCMAGQGAVILSIWEDVENKRSEADALRDTITDLNVELAISPSTTPRLAEFTAARDAAVRALALYELQWQQLTGAHIFVGEGAWNFGIRLIESADRSPVEVAQLVESISAQANSIARFGTVQGGTGGAATSGAAPPPPPLAATRSLAGLAELAASQSSMLLTGLPNVESLVLGFERCAATALVGGQPAVTRIQRVSLVSTQP